MTPKGTKVYAEIFYSTLRTGGKKISRPCRRSKRRLLDAIDALLVDCQNNCAGTTFLLKQTEDKLVVEAKNCPPSSWFCSPSLVKNDKIYGKCEGDVCTSKYFNRIGTSTVRTYKLGLGDY